jgi:hypothetical protein
MKRLIINGGDGFAYRATITAITIRGGNAIASERREFAERHDRGELDDNMVLTLPSLSLLRYSTQGIDRAVLNDEDTLPDTPHWQPIELGNEDDFLDIPENVLTQLIAAIMDANPHRKMEFDFLSRALDILQKVNASALTSSAPNGSVSEPVSPDA